MLPSPKSSCPRKEESKECAVEACKSCNRFKRKIQLTANHSCRYSRLVPLANALAIPKLQTLYALMVRREWRTRPLQYSLCYRISSPIKKIAVATSCIRYQQPGSTHIDRYISSKPEDFVLYTWIIHTLTVSVLRGL